MKSLDKPKPPRVADPLRKAGRLLLGVSCLVVVLGSQSVFAQTSAVTDGLAWLKSAQNPDGSWGGAGESLTLPFHAASEVLSTYAFLKMTSDPGFGLGSSFLLADPDSNVDFLARKIFVQQILGLDPGPNVTALTGLRNADGGFGGGLEYASNNLDTALALQALKAVNHSDQNVIHAALGYLLSTQNADGGWGFRPETCSGCGDADPSNVFVTAVVSSTLQRFPKTASLATAIDKASAYLVSHQNPGGGFGADAPTVFETSLAYLALAGVLGYIRHRVTNALAEGINSKIETIKKMACGFRNREHLRTQVLFHCGGLDLYPKAHHA